MGKRVPHVLLGDKNSLSYSDVPTIASSIAFDYEPTITEQFISLTCVPRQSHVSTTKYFTVFRKCTRFFGRREGTHNDRHQIPAHSKTYTAIPSKHELAAPRVKICSLVKAVRASLRCEYRGRDQDVAFFARNALSPSSCSRAPVARHNCPSSHTQPPCQHGDGTAQDHVPMSLHRYCHLGPVDTNGTERPATKMTDGRKRSKDYG
jgi:hypothetical protein